VHDVDAKKCRNKEENSSKERKRDIRLELGTATTASDAVPVPDASAIRSIIVGEKTKSDDEPCEENEVHGPVNKGRGEREEEEQGEEDADCGDDFGVDEALFVPC